MQNTGQLPNEPKQKTKRRYIYENRFPGSYNISCAFLPPFLLYEVGRHATFAAKMNLVYILYDKAATFHAASGEGPYG